MGRIHLKLMMVKKTLVYMSFFNNTDNDIEIESFSSNLSPRVEMHDIKITNDIAKMIMIKR